MTKKHSCSLASLYSKTYVHPSVVCPFNLSLQYPSPLPTPRNLLLAPLEINLQSLLMAIVDILLCSTRECSMFQIQCHGFSGDVQVMSCSCFTGKSINYHAATPSFHDAIPNSHTPSLPGIGKACVVLFACDVGPEDGEKAMLPVKDVDLSTVKYEHEVIQDCF